MGTLDTANQKDWHWLFEVDVDESTTRRYADHDMFLNNGEKYIGRLSDDSVVLSQELGRPEEAKEIYPDLEIVFDDPDQMIWNLLKSESWANKPCRAYVGHGRDFTNDYVLLFPGIVKHPGLVRRPSIYETSISVEHKGAADAVPLPPKAYSSAERNAIDTLQSTVAASNAITVSNGSQFKTGDLIRIDTNLGTGNKGLLITDVSGNDLDLDQAVSQSSGDEVAWLHYPNLETVSEGKKIAIGWGDWSTLAGGGEMVPVTCIDPTVPRFKIFEHAIPDGCLASINGGKVVIEDGAGETDVTSDTVNIDYERGTFEFNTTPYDPATDKVYVNCKGRTDDGTKDGALITLNTSIWEDLIKNYLGQSDSDIDQSAFTAWQTSVTSKGRLHIESSESSDDVVAAIMYATFSDQDFRNNKYYPVFRSLQSDPDADIYTIEDILDPGIDDNPQPEFSIDTDVELYLNRADYLFRIDPRTGEYKDGFEEDVAQQALVGAVNARTLEFRTLYDELETIDRAQLELLAFNQDVEIVEVTLKQNAMTKDLADNIILNFDVLTVEQLVTREVQKDIAGMVNRLVCWNISTIGVGHWAGIGASDYTSSSAQILQFQGYWANLLGEADPGNPASKLSKWFIPAA